MTTDRSTLMPEYKKFLGQAAHLDAAQLDTVAAHRLLGEDARTQIHKMLARRLDDAGGSQNATAQMRRARKYQAALHERMARPGLSDALRAALGVYLACVSAWAGGAALAEFRHPSLPDLCVDEYPVTPEDLAFALQEDEAGCQTGVYRQRDGSVVLWHMEEDYEDSPGQRFDQLRLFSFRAAGGATATAFIYPDLLPGPTFGWSNAGFAQAIDTLHIRWKDFGSPCLPNTLAWLSLYLGALVSRAGMAEALGPVQGGYSITALFRSGWRAEVEKIEFANDHFHVSGLGEAHGCYLFQTNALNDPALPIGAHQKDNPASLHWNGQRVRRTTRFVSAFHSADDALPLIFRMLRSRGGGDSAYANEDVKGYFVCRIAPEKMQVWVGSGPPMPGDELFTFEAGLGSGS